MPSPIARPLIHTAHLLTFLVLLVTGMLLLVPDLRAAVTGGYSQIVRDSHRWGGVAFFVLPLAILARFGFSSVFAPPPERTLRSLWQGLHVAITVAVSLLFTATGLVLWAKRAVPDSVLERSRDVHDWLTWAVVVLVAVHLAEIGIAVLVERFRGAAGDSSRR